MSYQLYQMNQLIHAQQLQIVELQTKLEVIQPKADQPQEWYKNTNYLIPIGLTTYIVYQKVSSWMHDFSLQRQMQAHQNQIKDYQNKVSEMQTEISDLQKVVADAKINLNRWQYEMELKIEGIEKAGSSVFKNTDRNGFSGAKTFGSFSLNSGKNVLDLSSIDLSSKEIDTHKSIEGETPVNNLEMKIISANKNKSPSKSSRLQKTRKRAVAIYNKIRQKSKPITQHFTENPVVKSIAKNVELKIELDFPKGSLAPIKNPQPEKEEPKKEKKTYLFIYPTISSRPIEADTDKVPPAEERKWNFHSQGDDFAVYVDVDANGETVPQHEEQKLVTQEDEDKPLLQQQEEKPLLEQQEKTEFSWVKNWMKKIKDKI